MKIIRDSIHKDIILNELEIKIINSIAFQKLRRIKQLGFSNLVYPGANHTRFEHSLGTFFLSNKIANNFNLEQDQIQKIRLYALLHDIGHIAFSHDSEMITKKYFENHEELGKKIILNSNLKDIINENFNVSEICNFEKNENYSIISSAIGADRMDYLLRDSHYTGVAYGIIDVDRIISTLNKNKNGELFVPKKSIESIESFLIARYLMFTTVYLHLAVRISTAMFQKALKINLDDNTINKEFLLSCGDEELILFLKNNKKTKELMTNLYNRNIYKLAYSFKIKEKTDKIEKILKEKTDIDFIISNPNNFIKEDNFLVKIEDDFFDIAKISFLISSLKKSQEKKIKTEIYCKKNNVKKLKEICEKEFN